MLIMKHKIISVIVPVYNTAPYLDRCLNSLLEQTYPHLEIILLNDASTDNSQHICDQYASKDHRIKVLHFSRHVGVCIRNYGISQATGEYLSFIDSDDSLAITTYQTAMQILEKYPDIDLIRWNIQKIFPRTGAILPDPYIFTEGILEHKGIVELLKKMLQNQESHNVCNCLFATSLVKQHNISFPPNIVMGEDACFLISFLLYCKKIYLIPRAYLYNYFQNTDSVSHRFSEDDIQLDLNFTQVMQKILTRDNADVSLINIYNGQLKSTLFGIILKLVRMQKSLLTAEHILQSYCQHPAVHARWPITKKTTAKWYYNITFSLVHHKFYKLAILWVNFLVICFDYRNKFIGRY